MSSKPFWKSKLFLIGMAMMLVAAYNAWLEGGDLDAVIMASFGALVVIFRKLTTSGMVFSFKEPSGIRKSIFAEIDGERDDEPTDRVKIVPNGDKEDTN